MRLPRLVQAVAIVLGVLATGCGGGAEGTDSSSASAGGSGASEDGGGEKLALGDTTTLKGLNGSVKVKVLKVEDPMKAPPPRGLIRERPRKGFRFVGVHVRMTNSGDEAYTDSLLNGSRLTTDIKKAARPTILLGGKCRSKGFGTSARIPAGATKTGCLPFQVKKKAKISAYQLTLDSGHGPETGTWAVR
jgi:Domain of unknown function (DUF4352)